MQFIARGNGLPRAPVQRHRVRQRAVAIKYDPLRALSVFHLLSLTLTLNLNRHSEAEIKIKIRIKILAGLQTVNVASFSSRSCAISGSTMGSMAPSMTAEIGRESFRER